MAPAGQYRGNQDPVQSCIYLFTSNLLKSPKVQCLGSPPASTIYIHHSKRQAGRGSRGTESLARSWLCCGCVLLMLLKFLLFYPVWVLKKEKRNHPALKATLPPPSPSSLVEHRAEQPSHISIRGERSSSGDSLAAGM